MHDPKQLVQLTSTQDIGGVLETYLVSIRTTFIFGLSCAIVCTLATLVVPWKPLLARNEVRSLRGSQSQVLLV